MVTCNGRGANGGHCCWLGGVECEYVENSRCTIWDRIPSPFYAATYAGRYMAERYPGYTCRDWPQNIPEVMAEGIGLCCWRIE
jgi:hypothetical protein